MSEFDAIYYDGFLLASLMRMAGSDCERVSFDSTSLAPQVFSESVRRGLTLYLIGGAPGVIEAAEGSIIQRHPELNVVGRRHGFFSSPQERTSVIEEIATLDPAVVVVGMGAPLQEHFLIDLRSSGWSGCGYTCGGFFHQSARRGAAYYPEWINRMNLRFLFRIWDEPKLLQRYIIEYPKFLVVFAADVLTSVRQRMSGI